MTSPDNPPSTALVASNCAIVPLAPVQPPAITSPTMVHVQGAGKAYQAVAQSSALAVQDAVSYMRSVMVVGSTAIGVASSRMIEEGKTEPWSDIVTEAQAAVDAAATTLQDVGGIAASILNGFPYGEETQPLPLPPSTSSTKRTEPNQ